MGSSDRRVSLNVSALTSEKHDFWSVLEQLIMSKEFEILFFKWALTNNGFWTNFFHSLHTDLNRRSDFTGKYERISIKISVGQFTNTLWSSCATRIVRAWNVNDENEVEKITATAGDARAKSKKRSKICRFHLGIRNVGSEAIRTKNSNEDSNQAIFLKIHENQLQLKEKGKILRELGIILPSIFELVRLIPKIYGQREGDVIGKTLFRSAHYAHRAAQWAP